MPGRHTSPMDQNTPGLADSRRDRLSRTELCARDGVSRQTGDTGVDRALTHGPPGREARSRRPSTSPRHTPDPVVAASLDARPRQPSWGAKPRVSLLSTRHPRWPGPARSPVCDLRNRHGVGPKTRQRRASGPPGHPPSHMGAPNAVWRADVTGHVKTGDGRDGSPLPITEGDRRVRRSCHALASTRGVEATPVFTRVFTAFGRPQRIRPAHGVPCATTTLRRLSPLSAWGVRLGLLPAGLEPGIPQQHGRHARRPRPWKADTTPPPALGGLSRARVSAAARRATTSARTRPSTGAPPPPAMHPPPGRGPTNRHRARTLTASRGATSAPTVASGGPLKGAPSHPSASEQTSASKTLTRASGLCTAAPAHVGGGSHGIGALQRPMVDSHAAGDGDPGRRTLG
jgi:hypothetical protein